MQARFAKGGDSAKSATSEVLKALFEMDDKVKQNQAGVDLFGTMWEDLGIDGVKALMKVNGFADKTKNTMKRLKTSNTMMLKPIGQALAERCKLMSLILSANHYSPR